MFKILSFTYISSCNHRVVEIGEQVGHVPSPPKFVADQLPYLNQVQRQIMPTTLLPASPLPIRWVSVVEFHDRALSIGISVPTDLANWGPSKPDRTTKIFRTGPNGPGPDLPKKECDKTLQTTCHILTMLNAHAFFLSLCYWVFIKCWLYQKVNPLGEENSLTYGKQF